MGIENKILIDENVDDFIKIDLDKKNDENDIELCNGYNTATQLQKQSIGIPISYNKFFKEKIRKQYSFNMGFPRFDSDLYPVEMSNYLTEREYKSSIDQINQVLNHYRRISNIFHALLGFETLSLFVAAIICFFFGFEDEIFIIFAVVILIFLAFLSSLFTVIIVRIKRKAFKKVNDVTFQLNQVYSDRGVRFEIVRKSYNSCKGFVYYPNYSVPFSQPQVQLYHLPIRSPLPPPLPHNKGLINNSYNINNNNNNNNNNGIHNNKNNTRELIEEFPTQA